MAGNDAETKRTVNTRNKIAFIELPSRDKPLKPELKKNIPYDYSIYFNLISFNPFVILSPPAGGRRISCDPDGHLIVLHSPTYRHAQVKEIPFLSLHQKFDQSEDKNGHFFYDPPTRGIT
jgi:hypothetical protein